MLFMCSIWYSYFYCLQSDLGYLPDHWEQGFDKLWDSIRLAPVLDLRQDLEFVGLRLL